MHVLSEIAPYVLHSLIGWVLFLGLIVLAVGHEWVLDLVRSRVCRSVRKILSFTAIGVLVVECLTLLIWSANVLTLLIGTL